MKKALATASAALLVAASSALAQAPAQTPGAPTPAPGFGIQRDGAAPAPANPEWAVDIETIVVALAGAEAAIGAVPAVAADATIRVIDIDQYLAGDGAAAITPALDAAEPHAEALRTAIQANPTLMARLQSENLGIEDVVGFGLDGANVLVFVRQSTGNADANAAGAAADGPGGAAPAP